MTTRQHDTATKHFVFCFFLLVISTLSLQIDASLSNVRASELPESLQPLEEGCNAGNQNACVELGIGHLNRRDGISSYSSRSAIYSADKAERRNRAEADKLFEAACLSGNNLGCYRNGILWRDDHQDYNERAVWYFSKGCELQHYESCIEGGKLIWRNPLVDRDPLKAIEFFAKACDAGITNGCYFAGLVHNAPNYRSIEDSNASKALQYLSAACGSGHTDACEKMAELEEQREKSQRECDLGEQWQCKRLRERFPSL